MGMRALGGEHGRQGTGGSRAEELRSVCQEEEQRWADCGLKGVLKLLKSFGAIIA